MTLTYPILKPTWDALSHLARPADISDSGVRLDTDDYVKTLASRFEQLQQTVVDIRDYETIQDAINAAGGKVLYVPQGEWEISVPLNITQPMVIRLDGYIKASAAWAGATILNITAVGDVAIEGAGGLDGNGQSLTTAILSVAPTRQYYMSIRNITIKSVQPGYDTADDRGPISWQFVDYGIIDSVKIRNCGGAGMYLSNCRYCTVTNNVISAPGFLGIVLGACGNCSVRGNTVYDAGYFCFKSGFGTTTHTPTADEAATLTMITVAADADSRRQFVAGQHIYVLETSPSVVYDSEITLVEDLGTYLRITVEGFAGIPTVGRELLLCSKSLAFTENIADGSGENAFDHNIEQGLLLANNTVTRAGLYTAAVGGAYVGVCSGIWVGADPYLTFTGMYCKHIVVTGNNVSRAKGGGVVIWSCSGPVTVTGNGVYDIDRGNDPGAPVVPTYAAISVNNLTYVRCDQAVIDGNVVHTDEGLGIQIGYALGVSVAGNRISSPAGVRFTDLFGRCSVVGNTVLSNRAGATALGFIFSTQSVASLVVDGNDLENDQASGHVIEINDPNAAGIIITKNNRLISGGAARVTANCASIACQAQWMSPLLSKVPAIGGSTEDYVQHEVASLASVVLCEYEADPGTAGGALLDLIAWNTGGREIAEYALIGDTGASAGALTSKAGGVAVFAAPDFAISTPGGNTVRLTYTNNSGSTVRLAARILNVSRF